MTRAARLRIRDNALVWGYCLGIALCWIVAASVSRSVAQSTTDQSPDSGGSEAEVEVTETELSSLATAEPIATIVGILQQEYAFTNSQSNTWTATNVNHGLALVATATGITVSPLVGTEPMFTLSLQTSRFGRVDAASGIVSSSVSVDGAQFTNSHGAVTEWVKNTGEGIEQGFTVSTSPTSGSGHLLIDLSLGGNLLAFPDESHTAVRLLDGKGVIRLVYSSLQALDENRHTLPATIAVLPNVIRIEVDDAGATYPVTIDPIISSTPESVRGPSQSPIRADQLFGYSVSAIGNVETTSQTY